MRVRFILLLLGSVFVAGCGDDTSSPDAGPADDAARPDAGADAGADASTPPRCSAEPEVVTFTTDDGIDLVGDLYLSGVDDGPAAVLLHMIPPANDRTNYPEAFIDELVSRCITVLNIDRRGAGDSAGDPVEAYMGPNGALDAKGAVEFLLAHPSRPNEARIAVVGASNGTTTALDFTVFTEQARTLMPPAAVVFLSGGTYTETQQAISETTLMEIETLFAYPVAERDWNVGFMAGAPPVWSFREYEPGAHGTGLFGSNPESMVEVADFVAAGVSE